MFVDKANIRIKAGDGGDGAVAFHREKYVAAGGPDGGDGGKGGDIVFVADTNLSTLADFRYKRKYTAQRGENGRGGKCNGKNAQNLVIRVPFGTVIKEESTGRILADISDNEPHIVAKGGKGGWGNPHFANAVRQVPRFAKPGLPGEEYDVVLELKLLADVGLVGFPNVGKSTLVSVVSQAKPEIANYHFTTITPVLGVVSMGEGSSFVMADIPGLIEGAWQGTGLGHQFLRHVERCRMLVHIVDVSGSEGRDPREDFETINSELEKFNPELAERPMIVAGNKCDTFNRQSYRLEYHSEHDHAGTRCSCCTYGSECCCKYDRQHMAECQLDAEAACDEDRAYTLIDSSTVHVDGSAERKCKACYVSAGTHLLSTLQADRQCCDRGCA